MYENDSYTSLSDISNQNGQTSLGQVVQSAPNYMERASQGKDRALQNLNNYASLEDSYTQMEDGRLESNSNKIWNELSDSDYQNLFAYTKNKYLLIRNEDNTLSFSDGSTYEGDARRLYQFGTKNLTNEEVKLGLSRGDLSGAEARYTPNGDYGWDSGHAGVDVQSKQMDALLPYSVATMLEGLGHGRANALKNRAVANMYDGSGNKEAYGSGASEYYKTAEGLYGKPNEIIDYDKGRELFKQYFGSVQNKFQNHGIVDQDLQDAYLLRQTQEYAADNMDTLDRAGNALAGFGSALVAEAVVNPLDAIGDGTGLYDLGSAEEKESAVNNAFGYNPVPNERAMTEIGQEWDVITSDDASSTDKLIALASAIGTAATTPEMLGTSLGTLTAWAAPTKVLKVAGVGTKFSDTMKAVNAAKEAGVITANQARIAKAKAAFSSKGVAAAVTNQAGHLSAALGNVNDQYEQFVENNGGVELEGAEKLEWTMERLGIQLINQNLDKITDVSLMKSNPLVKNSIGAFKAMTNKEFSNVAKAVGSGVAKAVGSMGLEAAQEYSQTMMEVFNARYGSEKFKDVNSFMDFVTDDRNVSEAGIAALAGAGGALQFKGVGATKALVGKGVDASKQKFEEVNKSTVAPEETPKNSSTASEESLAGKVYGNYNKEDKELTERIEAQIASEYESLSDGSNEVLKSDEDFEIKTTKLEDKFEAMAASGEDLDLDQLITKIADLVVSEPTLQKELAKRLQAKVAEGREFASIKEMDKTTEEVFSGDRGYATYFAEIKKAKADNNINAYAMAVDKFDNFINLQNQKLSNYTAGIQEVGKTVLDEARMLMQQGKATTLKGGLIELRKKYRNEYGKDKSIKKRNDKHLTVRHSNSPNSGETNISYYHVIDNLINPEKKSSIFKLRDQVANELQAMQVLRSSVDSNIEDLVTRRPQTVSEPVFDDVSINTLEDVVEPTENVVEAPVVNEQVVEEPIIETTEEPTIEEAPVEVVNETTEPVQETKAPEIVNESVKEQTPKQEAVKETTEKPVDNEEVLKVIKTPLVATPNEDFEYTEEDLEEVVEETPKTEKEVLLDNLASLKSIKKEIREVTSALKKQKATDEEISEALSDLNLEKVLLEDQIEGANKVKKAVDERIQSSLSFYSTKKGLSKDFSNGKTSRIQTSPKELFSKIEPTGFNAADSKRSRKNATFADRIVFNLQNNPSTYYDSWASLLVFDKDGQVNYTTIEAMQSAVYDYVYQAGGDLYKNYINDDYINTVFGRLEGQHVPHVLREILPTGGVTLRAASDSIGKKVMENLGIKVDKIEHRSALESILGISALLGVEGTLTTIESIDGKAINAKAGKEVVNNGKITLVKGLPFVADGREAIKKVADDLRESAGLERNTERTYRTLPKRKSREVGKRRSNHQKATKAHSKAINTLENTSFSFNSGYEVLKEVFGDGETIDTEKLLEHIAGDGKEFSAFDSVQSYLAQKGARKEDIKNLLDAYEDVGVGKDIYFNWFVAKQDRLHLDSNKLNPQTEKMLARWLVTATKNRKTVTKEEITDKNNLSKQGIMFLYSIVQAFDGADDIVSIDKDEEGQVIDVGLELLNKSDKELKSMAMDSDHVGHAMLAIANIRKLQQAESSFESDMVLEVDGLTNGFAFRLMQFPIVGDKKMNLSEWLFKIGTVVSDGNIGDIESMNQARSKGQEDVYISVGNVFKRLFEENLNKVNNETKAWIGLFQKYGKIPDFEDQKKFSSFIRNLMKSPVMIFNYAAGIGKITGSLVEDQILGKGYMKGRGLIDLLTSTDENGNYLVTEEELINTFGDKGVMYHRARGELRNVDIEFAGSNDIKELRKALFGAVGQLYSEPLKESLETLFGNQTVFNSVINNASGMLLQLFTSKINEWRVVNPDATEEDFTQFLKDNADIIPSIAGANSDSLENSLSFVKKITEETKQGVAVMKNDGQYLNTSTTIKSLGDIGVGSAVLPVLSLDSSVMVNTINSSYTKNNNSGMLPVHDALVLGIGESDVIKNYNEDFYTTNRRYSTIDEMVKVLSAAKDKYPEIENMSYLPDVGAKEPISFKDIYKELLVTNAEVQEAREELFSKDVKIGQMVGPNGTMGEFNIKTTKENSIKFLSAYSSKLKDLIHSEKFKESFGDKAETHIKEIEKMIEGC